MVTSFLLAALLCCYGTLGDDLSPCPDSLVRNKYLRTYGNRCFEFVIYRETYWDNADNECVHKGGQLATVNDQATQRYLESALISLNWVHKGLWIGLNDRNKEGQYEWISGEAVKYSHWAPGQPSLFHNLEDCVLMYRPDNYAWRDHECHIWPQYYGFICEYQMVQPGTASTVPIQVSTAPSSTPPVNATTIETSIDIVIDSTTEVVTTRNPATQTSPTKEIPPVSEIPRTTMERANP